MHNNEISRFGNVVSLDAARQRRRHIALAQSDENFRAVAASFALSDINRQNALDAFWGGLISYDQAVEEICQQHATDES